MRLVHFAAEETVFAEGDASDAAYLIRSGRVEVLKDTPAGMIRLAILGEGDIVGEMGVIDDRPRSAGVRALEPVTAIAVNHQEFIDTLLHQPRDALALLRALFERLRSADQALARYAKPMAGGDAVPQVTLQAAAPEARGALPAAGVVVARFPFRIGRKPFSHESDLLAMNEVMVADRPPPRLSLNHFAIDLDGVDVVVRDRGSRDGTIVNGVAIGNMADRDVVVLRKGENDVIAGKPDSPYRYKVIVA
ncbi:MAG: cyclic nucleotide-binding domain-containing protein [Dongiaceae bacterium]